MTLYTRAQQKKLKKKIVGCQRRANSEEMRAWTDSAALRNVKTLRPYLQPEASDWFMLIHL